jgi:hypothetical protein
MKVFISWSGESSHQVALLLRDWLPVILQTIDAWVSSEDILKGSSWWHELTKLLEGTSFGIICVDSSNINSPWLNFEAGALIKSISASKVAPVLLDIEPKDLKGPLSLFQATSLKNKEDMRKLVHSINRLCPSPLPEERVNKAFDLAWPNLENSLKKIVPMSSVTPVLPLAQEPVHAKTQVISDEEEKILVFIAQEEERIRKRGRKDFYQYGCNELSSEEIAQKCNMPIKKVERLLERLKDKGFVWYNFPLYSGNAWWSISTKGLDYLIDNGLL